MKSNPGRKAEDVCWRPRLHHAVDVKHTTAGYTEQNAVDFLLYHLEGAAGEEFHLRPSEEEANRTAIFKILHSVFGEGFTSTQALSKFFER